MIYDCEYDADSDATYCSEAERVLLQAEKLKHPFVADYFRESGSKDENEQLFTKNGISGIERTSSNAKMSKCAFPVGAKAKRKQMKNYAYSRKKLLHCSRNMKMMEAHREKMKKYGQTLMNRLSNIRNDVSMWLTGCEIKLNKTQRIALFEEVKLMKETLSKLYDASKRIRKHAGGKMSLSHKTYLEANQTCERLLVQLNPATLDMNFISLKGILDTDYESDDNDIDSENIQNSISASSSNEDIPNRGKSYVKKRNVSFNETISYKEFPENELCLNTNVKPLKTCRGVIDVIDDHVKLLNSSREDNNKIQNKNITNQPYCSEEVNNLTDITLSSVTLQEKSEKVNDKISKQDTVPNISANDHRILHYKELHSDETYVERSFSDKNDPKTNIVNERLQNQLKKCNPLCSERMKDDKINTRILCNEKNSMEQSKADSEFQYFDLQIISQSQSDSQVNVTNLREDDSQKSVAESVDAIITHRKSLENTANDVNDFDSSYTTSEEEIIESSLPLVNIKHDSKKRIVRHFENPENLSYGNSECDRSSSVIYMTQSDKMNESQGQIDKPPDDIALPTWCSIFEQHKKKNSLPTLIELMLAGMLHPGELVLTLPENNIKASLLKNGQIRTLEGATFHSPMAWCSAWCDGRSVSKNLAYQRVHYKGKSLMEICRHAFKTAAEKIANSNKDLNNRTNSSQSSILCHPINDRSQENNEENTEFNLIYGSVTERNPEINEEYTEFQDPILAIKSVLLHSCGEFQVDENYEEAFWHQGEYPADTKFIDMW